MTATRHVPLLAAAALALALAACAETVYEFDDVTVGGDDSARTPRERSDGQFLRLVYADLLGRTPEVYEFVASVAGQTEVARFTIDEQVLLLASLDGVGDPSPMRSLIVKGLLHSQEVDVPDKSAVDDPEAYVAEQFRRFLGRDPGVHELRAFVQEWESDPATGPRAIIRALIASREYQSF